MIANCTAPWIVLAVLLSKSCFGQIIAERPALKAGDQWVYREVGTDAGVTVNRRWSRRILESLPDGKVRVAPTIHGVSIFDESWNPRHPDRPEFFPRDFAFPLRVGAQWSFASPPGAYYQRGDHTAVAQETITVPAGTFECLRLEGMSVYNYGKSYSETWRMTRWYCPAIKYMAKLHFERDIWQAYFPPARSVLDSELVDFNLARPAAEMPLPPDVKVEGPAESLPPASGGLVGKWTGTWSNGVNHVLVVERIDSSSTATVVFARDRAPALNIDRPFYARFTAAVSNGELQFKIRNGLATVSYVLTEEGYLSGKLISESGTPALIRMSRFE